ncbi:SH3 domain-containing protein [Streptomyces sp. CRN 30]|uniref:SH3 domain-containing protein n=1 Tax=Streptomyces sp. CRN 30 TaxID=3075613 RepID=UPI002A819B58|nr:SH3 domain-containing protein [Streptomyces sp. CRN 30]
MSRNPHPRPARRLTARLAITAAAGALAAAAAVTPAAATAASDEWSDDPGQSSFQGETGSDTWGEAGGPRGGDHGGGHGDGHGGGHHEQGRYRGIVTADRLALRSAPNRGSEIIRYAHRGETVSIYCKTAGEKVKHNPIWYLLTDGTWAWGAARYIDNVGPSPRWC